MRTSTSRASSLAWLLLMAATAAAQQQVTLAEGKPSHSTEKPLKASWKDLGKEGNPVLEYQYRVLSMDGAREKGFGAYTSAKLLRDVELKGFRFKQGQQVLVRVRARYAAKPTTWSASLRSNVVAIEVPEEEAPAVEESPGEALGRFAASELGLSAKPAEGEGPGAAVLRALEDPKTLNTVLKSLLEGEHPLLPLKDLKLEIKAMEGENQESVLGIGWTYEKVLHSLPFDVPATYGLDLRATSEGTAAFHRENNPKDFLKGSLGLAFFLSSGGVTGDPSGELQDRLIELVDLLVDIQDVEALDRSPHWREFDEIVRRFVTTQVYVDLAIDAGIEANQGFTSKQAVFEGSLGFDLKAWNDDSWLAKYNFFDLGCAIVRLLSGYDQRLSLRGSTIPVVRVGLALVDPFDGDPRSDLGDETSFWRFSAKAGFRSPLARIAGSTVYLDAFVRYDRELDPARVVRDADLHSFRYATLAVVSSTGLFVSYSAGHLPFDAEEDRVYEAGLKVAF